MFQDFCHQAKDVYQLQFDRKEWPLASRGAQDVQAPLTTVFLGILYPPNVYRKCPKGTGHRGKKTNAQPVKNLKTKI